jgi:hypothetical protein
MACFSVSSYGTYHFDSLVLPCLFCSSINRICTSRALREPLLRHRGTPPAQARPRSFLPYCSAKCAGHWARCPFPHGAASSPKIKKTSRNTSKGCFLFCYQRQSATIEAGGNAFPWDYDALRVGTPAVLWRRLHAWFCRLQPTEHRRNAGVSWVSHYLTLSLPRRSPLADEAARATDRSCRNSATQGSS